MPLVKTWCHPKQSNWEYRRFYSVMWSTILWELKDGLVNAPVGAWSVVASSDKTVASLGDVWGSYTDVRIQNDMQGTRISPGSWMLLKSPDSPKGPYWMLMEVTAASSNEGTPIRFHFMQQEPDLSNLVTYRLPPFIGPVLWAQDGLATSSSGAPADIGQIDLLVAHDGSFCLFVRHTRNSTADQTFVGGYVIFNIMDEVPPIDTFGAYVFVSNHSGGTDHQGTSIWRTQGRGLDRDGVMTTLSAVRKYRRSGAYVNTYGGIAQSIVEDYYWNKYGSETIYTYCADPGRNGYRGRLVDLWWCPGDIYSGMVGYIDPTTRVCNMQGLWVPSPEMPFKIG